MERQCGSSYTINQASRLRGTHYLHYWACAGGSLFLVKEGRAEVRNPGVDCPALAIGVQVWELAESLGDGGDDEEVGGKLPIREHDGAEKYGM
jgi:hypothetical protein